MRTRLIAVLAILGLSVVGAAAQQQYDANGKARVSVYNNPSNTPIVVTGTFTPALIGKTTTEAKLTVSVSNTYQQALASNSSRTGCTVQYISVAGSKGYVYFGSAPADTTTSFQLVNGQALNCSIGGVAVATDAINVTGTATDIFVISSQ